MKNFRTEIPAYAVGPGPYLRTTYLIQLFQEAARRDTVYLEVDSGRLAERHGLTWVLHRQVIDITSLPRLGQAVRVVTYPTHQARGLITYRDFYLFADDDQPLVTATTAWSVLDIQRRQLRKLPPEVMQVVGQLFPPPARLPWPEGRPTAPTGPVSERTFRVGFADLDFNDHLTNSTYPALMSEPLGDDLLRSHLPVHLDVVYQREARYGEVLRATAAPRAGGERGFAHGLFREGDGETLAVMHTRFRKIA